MRSMTLIPVKSTSCFVESSSNLGGSRCMLLRLVDSTLLRPSIESPMTLKRRPFTCSPVGIEIGAPRQRTFMPLRSPSVESMAMVRMVFSPISCCTSVMSFSPLARSISRASKRFGRCDSSSKATSITGPIICTIRPYFSSLMINLLQRLNCQCFSRISIGISGGIEILSLLRYLLC